MYTNLVLSGGALRAIAILGAIKYLEQLNLIKNIKEYVGTSAGSIISFLIIIGYTSNQIIDLFKNNIDFVTNFNFDLTNITNILEDYGIDDCNRNKQILEDFLLKKINKKTITFLELTKKYGINFIVTGSNLTTRQVDYFNVNNTPNMNIIDALLISSCIPLVYKPITYNDYLYVDGGIYSNLPLTYFKNNSNETLGIYVQTYYSNKNENFFNYFTNIISSVMDKLSYDEILNNKYNVCLIFYNESRSNDVNFNIDDFSLNVNKDVFYKYYNYGFKQFKKFYDNLIEKKNIEINNLIKN
jgi:predicted acylesterase/phospholipase RssA